MKTRFAMKLVHAQNPQMTGVLETHDKMQRYCGEYVQIQLVHAITVSQFDLRNYMILELDLPSNKVHKLTPILITPDMCNGNMPSAGDLTALVNTYVNELEQSQLKTVPTVSICTPELAFSICELVRCPIGEQLMDLTNAELVDIATWRGHTKKEIAAAVLMLRIFSDVIDGHLANMETIPC